MILERHFLKESTIFSSPQNKRIKILEIPEALVGLLDGLMLVGLYAQLLIRTRI